MIPVASCSLLIDCKSEAKVPHSGIAGKENSEGLTHDENDSEDRTLRKAFWHRCNRKGIYLFGGLNRSSESTGMLGNRG